MTKPTPTLPSAPNGWSYEGVTYLAYKTHRLPLHPDTIFQIGVM